MIRIDKIEKVFFSSFYPTACANWSYPFDDDDGWYKPSIKEFWECLMEYDRKKWE